MHGISYSSNMCAALSKPAREPGFVSRQVTEARRYYLDLQPPSRSALTVVCGGVERMRPDYRVARDDFPFYAVELVVEGAGRVRLKNASFPLRPGTVFGYGPGVAHVIETDPHHRMRKYYMDFAGREAASLMEECGLAQWRPVSVAAPHELVELFEAMAREAAGEGPLTRRICAGLARVLLLKVAQVADLGGSNAPLAFATYERLRDHAGKHFLRLGTVEELAGECHVTPMYASRLFRRFARTGAYQYLLRLKMNRAAEFLLDDGLLVKETAERLGFADPFQFSRAFKRVHGVPPSRLLWARGVRTEAGLEPA